VVRHAVIARAVVAVRITVLLAVRITV
jgi:hypothetical protein